MADLTGIEVVDMPSASQVNDNDLFMIVQSGVNKKLPKSILTDNLGNQLELVLDNQTFQLFIRLKNAGESIISTSNTIDLPLESVVVSATYDNVTKELVLTLQSGSTLRVPIGDLISGLQTEITSNNKLSADLVDDSNSTNKFANTLIVTSISSSSTDSQIPSAKCVYDIIGNLETILETLDVGGGVQ